MSLKKIDTITLYTYEDENVDQGYHLRTFLANNNIEFQHLHYNRDANKKDILSPLNSWIDPNDEEVDLNDFPFIIFRKVIEEETVVIKTTESGKPVYTEDGEGRKIFEYETSFNDIELFTTIRSREQLEQSNIVELYNLDK
jgi:hypothetical protein